jgi:hypothetical protein
MDLEMLALAVDEQVRVPAADRRDGRLYAVRCPSPAGGDDGEARTEGGPTTDSDTPGDGDDGGARPGSPARAVKLELLAEGEARTLPQKVRPPAGARAIALVSGVWAAPMDDAGPPRPPSRHPERRRAHLTVIVGGEDGRDGVDVSVLRYSDGAPTVLRGGLGLIHQRMLRCWSRRPDAAMAPDLPPAA